jgi:iron complex outermembrane receptor protein
LSFDLAAYYYDYKNIQVMSQDTDANGRPETVITNAATARVWGIEGQLQYLLTDDLEANLALAYADPKYRSYPGSPAYVQNAFGLFDNIRVDASGNQRERAAKFSGTLQLKYTTDLAHGRLGLSTNVYMTSKVYFDSSNQFSQGGYATVGLRAEWTDPSERYTVAVYGNNITNKRYITQILGSQTGINSYWNWPATVGASIRARFN